MKLFKRALEAGFVLPDFSQYQNKFTSSNCRILDGKLLSSHFIEQAKKLSVGRKIPMLVVILVGNDPASIVYVNNKIKIFTEAGFNSKNLYISESDFSEDSLVSKIKELNSDKNVDGILVQLPLPKTCDVTKILNTISPNKDVDGFLASSIGSVTTGEFTKAVACTPLGIMLLLHCYGISLAGKNAVVLGRSNIVGKPAALLLLSEDSTVTIAHSKSQNLRELCQSADILVAAIGKPEFIEPADLKEGAVVIDVGIHRKADGKLCGDVAHGARLKASALTPVPGGVGPMTIAMLLVNTALSAWVN